jgi:hypothetical protein
MSTATALATPIGEVKVDLSAGAQASEAAATAASSSKPHKSAQPSKK